MPGATCNSPGAQSSERKRSLRLVRNSAVLRFSLAEVASSIRRYRARFCNAGEFFVIVNNSQESLSFEPRELIAEGDKVVELGTYSWRVRSTRREFSGDFAHVWTFRGKAVVFHEYTDTAALAKAHQKAASA